jgi:hypothetical protein
LEELYCFSAEVLICDTDVYILDRGGGNKGKGKGKAIPLQAWSGFEGSKRVRLPDFKTIDI